MRACIAGLEADIEALKAEKDEWKAKNSAAVGLLNILGERSQRQQAELESDRNAWRESAEQLGRQIASLTHKIPTDIPLQESSDE